MAETEDHKKMMNESLEKIHNLLWNDSGLDPNIAMEFMYMFIALRMIEPQVDKLGLPTICKWSNLREVSKRDPGGADLLDDEINGLFKVVELRERVQSHEKSVAHPPFLFFDVADWGLGRN